MLLNENIEIIDESIMFRNLKNEYFSFHEVYEKILEFIKGDLNSSYKISIGTDSQVANRTVFVTCIHIHRVGKGAIGFLHKSLLQRPVTSLREKIYMETCQSLQLAYLFTDDMMKCITHLLNRKVSFEFHIDIGRKGPTKTLINEMMGLVRGSHFVPRIKPDSYCASCFADRFTKAM